MQTEIQEPGAVVDLEKLPISDALKALTRCESNIALLREFLERHCEKFKGINFYPAPNGDPQIRVYSCADPKSFARKFEGSVWSREASGYKCGSFNWDAVVDGVGIHIDEAELIKPKFVETVRL